MAEAQVAAETTPAQPMTLRERLLPRDQTRAALWMAGLLAVVSLVRQSVPRLMMRIPTEQGPNALPPGWLQGGLTIALMAGAGALAAWLVLRFNAPRASLGFLFLAELWLFLSDLGLFVYSTLSSGLLGPPLGASSPTPPQLFAQLAFYNLSGLGPLFIAAGAAAVVAAATDDGLLVGLGLRDRAAMETRLALWALALIVVPGVVTAAVSLLYLPFRAFLEGPVGPGADYSRAMAIGAAVAYGAQAVRWVVIFLVAYLGVRRWAAPRALWTPVAVGGLVAGIASVVVLPLSGFVGFLPVIGFAGAAILSASIGALAPVLAVSLAADRTPPPGAAPPSAGEGSGTIEGGTEPTEEAS